MLVVVVDAAAFRIGLLLGCVSTLTASSGRTPSPADLLRRRRRGQVVALTPFFVSFFTRTTTTTGSSSSRRRRRHHHHLTLPLPPLCMPRRDPAPRGRDGFPRSCDRDPFVFASREGGRGIPAGGLEAGSAEGARGVAFHLRQRGAMSVRQLAGKGFSSRFARGSSAMEKRVEGPPVSP